MRITLFHDRLYHGSLEGAHKTIYFSLTVYNDEKNTIDHIACKRKIPDLREKKKKTVVREEKVRSGNE